MITPAAIVGASCGDSQAWLTSTNAWCELTQNQIRKARLGTGRAQARPFTEKPCGIVLLATDGLFDYLELDAIAHVLRSTSDNKAEALVQLLRARYRTLPDDVAVVVAHLD